MSKRVSLVTLTYNQLEKATKPYIESLYANTDENLFELIIVDNASTDGTIEYLKKLETEKSNIKIIYNEENLGYSKGNNQGIKIAQGEFIGLLNNDIYFEKNWLEKTIRFIEKTPDAGLVSPWIVTPYDCSVNEYLNCRYKRPDTYSKKVLDALFCTVFFRKEAVNEIGLMDENFSPAWYEDNDYSMRFIKAGKQNYLYNEVCIYHNFSKTSSKLPKAGEIQERNKKYYFEKHGFMAEYCYELGLNNSLLDKDLKTIKKSIFWPLIAGELKIRARFEKIFRGLIKKMR